MKLKVGQSQPGLSAARNLSLVVIGRRSNDEVAIGVHTHPEILNR